MAFGKNKKRYTPVIIRHIENRYIIPNRRNFDGEKFGHEATGSFWLDVSCQTGLLATLRQHGYPVKEIEYNGDTLNVIKVKVRYEGEDWQISKLNEVLNTPDPETGKYKAIPITRENAGMLNSMNILEAHMNIRAYDYTANGGGTSIVLTSLFVKKDESNPVLESAYSDELADDYFIVEDDNLPFN